MKLIQTYKLIQIFTLKKIIITSLHKSSNICLYLPACENITKVDHVDIYIMDPIPHGTCHRP
jgi:hypothetical protein